MKKRFVFVVKEVFEEEKMMCSKFLSQKLVNLFNFSQTKRN